MSAIDYANFDLEITRIGKRRYRARVIDSPAGQASADFSRPFSDIELDNFVLRIGRPRIGTRRANSPEWEAAEKFGKKLFDTVFHETVRECFTSCLHQIDLGKINGLRIKLRLVNVPELANLPWEYLYNSSQRRFVVLSEETPLIRYLDLPIPTLPLSVMPPLRMLAVAPSPLGYSPLDVEEEKQKLETAVRNLVEHQLLEVEWLMPATLYSLQQRLRQQSRYGPIHLLHFIGHGSWDEQSQDGVLIFEDEQKRGQLVDAARLATVLHDHKSLRLVVLNACEGARNSPTDPYAGVASTLVQQGIPAVLAMQFEITDRAAIRLAQVFYESLADNYPAETALAQARKAIYALGNDIEWGTPVLYLRATDGQLFDFSKISDEPVSSSGPTSASSQSGGVNLTADEANIGADVIGRDKIVQNIFNISEVKLNDVSGSSLVDFSERLREQTNKAEADRQVKKRVETERLAKENADAERLAKEKSEADQLAKEKTEADRLARQMAEAERLAKEKAEADRLAKEKTEADRLARQKAEAEQLAKEKAEADQLANETEADRLAKQKAEAERLAKEKAEADRLAKARAEAERLSRAKIEAGRRLARKRLISLAVAVLTVTFIILVMSMLASNPPRPTATPTPSQPTQASALTQALVQTTAPKITIVPAVKLMLKAAPDCSYGGEMKSIEAVDVSAVKFTLCTPDPAFLYKIAFGSLNIQSAAYLQKTGGGGKGSALLNQPLGTGPYMLKEWVLGDHITLVTNPNYWGDVPKTKTVIITWGDSATRLTSLKSGKVDGIDNVNKDDFATVSADPTLKLYPRDPSLNVGYIGFNNTVPPFDNIKVRQALAIGIDRESLLKKFFPPGSTLADYFTPCPILGGCEGNPWPKYDLAAAKRVLADAGVKLGTKLMLSYRDVDRPYFPTQGKVAEEVQAQLKQLGFDVNLDKQESGTYLTKASNGELQIYILGYVADYPDQSDWVNYNFGKGAIDDRFGKKFDDLVAAIDKADTTFDPATRKTLYATVNNLILQYVPMVPVATGASAVAFKATVQGAHASPLNQETFSVMQIPDGAPLVFSQNGEPPSLYCADETYGEAFRVCTQIFDSLYAYKIGGIDAVPNLADSCTANTDGTEWTCKLHPGVKFSDGTLLTANDVVETYAVQWDAADPLHVGNTGDFTYWPGLFGAFLNAKK